MKQQTPIGRLAAFVVLCFAFACNWECQGDSFSSRMKMKGVVLPIFLGANSLPSAVIRAENIHSELQRKGFLRIGILRKWVAEGVTIELSESLEISSTLLQVHDSMKSFHTGSLIELRRVAFRFPNESVPRVQAGRVLLRERSRWQLSDSVTIQTPTGCVETAKATLHILGPQAGTLTWETPAGFQSLNLVSPCGSTNSTAGSKTETK
ncbi:MAG: hypothetical protein L0Z50_27860 [Verrucomicrobiales bacterium]|nr:hypothetical protein [Verrucomicrobiales bacterium]